MKDLTLLRVGIAGTVIAALCCFTPVLVVLVGVVGLSAIAGYLDLVLFAGAGGFCRPDELRSEARTAP